MWWTINLTVTALILISKCHSQDTATFCQNGGSCLVTSGGKCITCDCAPGYTGDTCSVLLTKIRGSVTYRSTNFTVFAFNEAGFKQVLQASIIGYHDSSTTNRSRDNILFIVDYVAYMQRPVEGTNFNKTLFLSPINIAIKRQSSINATFFNSTTGITISSAVADIDECASNLYTCDVNADCYNTINGYGCTCRSGYMGNGTHCPNGTFCKLSDAPAWPNAATRSVYYHNGVDISKSAHGDLMPYKTFIEYKCPEGYTLVNAETSEAQTTVIECTGTDQPTHQNTGWAGNVVRCDMKVDFMVAIVMAVGSCAIIVLVGGAFVVSHTNKNKKKNEPEDTDVLEIGVGNTSSQE